MPATRQLKPTMSRCIARSVLQQSVAGQSFATSAEHLAHKAVKTVAMYIMCSQGKSPANLAKDGYEDLLLPYLDEKSRHTPNRKKIELRMREDFQQFIQGNTQVRTPKAPSSCAETHLS